MNTDRAGYAKVLAGLYLATFLLRASFGLSWATLGHHVTSTGFALGVIVSASALVELVSVLFIGSFIDRYGRRGMLLFGLLIAAVSRAAIAATTDQLSLALINAAYGFGAAAIMVSSLAMVTDYAPAESRGREMGAFDFANIFGYMVGYAGGLALLKFFGQGLGPVFLLAAALGLAGFVYCFFYVKEHADFARPAEQRTRVVEFKPQGLRVLFRDRSFVFLVAPWFIVFFLLSSFATFYPRAVQVAFDGPGDGPAFLAVAAWTLVVGVVVLATQIFFGKLSDRVGRMPVMLAGGIGFFGLAAGFGLSVIEAPEGGAALTGLLTQWWPVHFVFLVAALAFGPSALASLADLSNKHPAGITMGVYTLVVAMGMILGPPITGFVADRFGAGGTAIVFFVAATIMMLLIAVRFAEWWFFERKETPEGPVEQATRKVIVTERARAGTSAEASTKEP